MKKIVLSIFVIALLALSLPGKAAENLQNEETAASTEIINNVWGASTNWGTPSPRIRDISVFEQPKDNIRGLYVQLRTDDNLFSSFIWKWFMNKCIDSVQKIFADPRLGNITDVAFVGSFMMLDEYGQASETDVLRFVIPRVLANKIKWENLTREDVAGLLQEEEYADFWIDPALDN